MKKCKKKPRSALKNHWSIVDKACHRHTPRDIWLSQVSSHSWSLDLRWLWPWLGHRGIKNVCQAWQDAKFLLAAHLEITGVCTALGPLVKGWTEKKGCHKLRRDSCNSPFSHSCIRVTSATGLAKQQNDYQTLQRELQKPTGIKWTIQEVLRQTVSFCFHAHCVIVSNHSFTTQNYHELPIHTYHWSADFLPIPLAFRVREPPTQRIAGLRVVYKACLGMFYANSNQRLASGILAGNWPTNAQFG